MEAAPSVSLTDLGPDALAEVARRLSLDDRKRLGLTAYDALATVSSLSVEDYRRTFVEAIGAPPVVSVGQKDEQIRMWTYGFAKCFCSRSHRMFARWNDFFSVLYQMYDFVVRDRADRIERLRLSRTTPDAASVIHVRRDGGGTVIGVRLHHPRLFHRLALAWIGTRRRPEFDFTGVPEREDLFGRIAVQLDDENDPRRGRCFVADLPSSLADAQDAPLDLAVRPLAAGRHYSTESQGGPLFGQAANQWFETYAFQDSELPRAESDGYTAVVRIAKPDAAGWERTARVRHFYYGTTVGLAFGAMSDYSKYAVLSGWVWAVSTSPTHVQNALSDLALDASRRRLALIVERVTGEGANGMPALHFQARFRGLRLEEQSGTGGWCGLHESRIAHLGLSFRAPTAESVSRAALPSLDASSASYMAGAGFDPAATLEDYNRRLRNAWMSLESRYLRGLKIEGYDRYLAEVLRREGLVGEAAAQRVKQLYFTINVASIFVPQLERVGEGLLALVWRPRHSIAHSWAYPDWGRLEATRKKIEAGQLLREMYDLRSIEVALVYAPDGSPSAFGTLAASRDPLLDALLTNPFLAPHGQQPPFGFVGAGLGHDQAAVRTFRERVRGVLAEGQAALLARLGPSAAALIASRALRVPDLRPESQTQPRLVFGWSAAPYVAGRLAQYCLPPNAATGQWRREEDHVFAFVVRA